MKRHIFTVIPFLALGGLLLTGCFDGNAVASADENPASSTAVGENADHSELATAAAVVGGSGDRITVKSTTRLYKFARFYYLGTNNIWVESRCVDITQKNVWIDTRFEVPQGLHTEMDFWISAKCNKRADRTGILGKAPVLKSRTWFITIL